MKIESIRTRLVRLPNAEPLADAPFLANVTRDFITVEVLTDDGVEGIGISFLFGGVLTSALKSALDELCALIIGDDPMASGAIQAKLVARTSAAGPEGLVMMAISAIDIALWDIKAKLAGVPLATLLGGAQKRVPTYASGALRRDMNHDQLAKAAQRLIERGYRQMKMQLALPGETSLTRELAAAQLVRSVIGPDLDLMVDINHRWDVRQALSIGPHLEQFNFYWIEDIVMRDEFAGMGDIARALATPLATGESLFGLIPFRYLIEAGGVDIVMADVFRAGGITGWMKIAALAESFNLPVVSHLAPEISIHLVGSIRNGLTVEYMPWSRALYYEVPLPKDGTLEAFDLPGLGLRFDQDALNKYGTPATTIR